MSLRVTSTGCSVVFKFNILSELILQVLISILALKLGIFGVVDKFCRKLCLGSDTYDTPVRFVIR